MQFDFFCFILKIRINCVRVQNVPLGLWSYTVRCWFLYVELRGDLWWVKIRQGFLLVVLC